MSSLTPRGWLALGFVAALALYLLLQVSANLWWIGLGSPQAEFLGWCWGSMRECVII